MKEIVVLYHANCPDGFGAAWVAWRKFKNRAEYIPVLPRQLPDKKLVGREIYVLDNSFSVPVQKELRRKNKKLMIIDHHGSAKKDVLAFSENIYDKKHSGSVLAWRYFYPKKPVPVFLRYVEEGDLWSFKLPHSEEIGSFIFGNNFDFKLWNRFCRDLETPAGLKRYAVLGKTINDFINVVTDEVVKRAYLVDFFGHKVLAANFSSKRFHSQVGHALCKKKPPMGVVWWTSGDELHVSLRSRGNFDVSKIARRFPEGGGHKHAAGFTVPFRNKFPWKVIRKNG